MTQPYDTTTRSGTARHAAAALCLGALLLAGCSGSESTINTADTGTGVVVNSAAAIAQESADDYNDNVNGLITGATLKRWISDWRANRPPGITGKLVIFQATTGDAPRQYIKPDNTNVFVYLSPSSEWTQTRSNGVMRVTTMVPDGATMDTLMKKYNIDPKNDMIVAAQGKGSPSNAMGQGRIWYALRYWGVDAKNLALLNGGNQAQTDMGDSDFSTTASTAPNSGTASVKYLPDNTALQATLEDLLAILPSSDTNVLTDGVFLWDARNLGQYSAGEKVELGEDTDPNTAGTQACADPSGYCTPTDTANYAWSFQSGSRQGHPWGALQLQYTRLVDANGVYLPKAQLAAYLSGEVNANGIGFVGADYMPVGMGGAYQPGDTVYTYCQTTMRAMITGVVSGVILGYPTRFYDGAMLEWNSLSKLPDVTGEDILPAHSPWRTDLKSFYRAAIDITKVPQVPIVDPFAASANKIVNDDKAYKAQAVMSGGTGSTGGTGGGLPPNPCGG